MIHFPFDWNLLFFMPIFSWIPYNTLLYYTFPQNICDFFMRQRWFFLNNFQ